MTVDLPNLLKFFHLNFVLYSIGYNHVNIAINNNSFLYFIVQHLTIFFALYQCLLSHTVLNVEFAQSSYTGGEQSGVIIVMLVLKGGNSTDNIIVTVTPSNQSPVSAEGVLC